MEFINQNTELVITLLTMTLTWILGFISKRCPYVNNNLIIIQNIVIGLSVSIFYFIITKDFNLAITLSGLFAETGYNLIHNIEKLIKEGNNGKITYLNICPLVAEKDLSKLILFLSVDIKPLYTVITVTITDISKAIIIIELILAPKKIIIIGPKAILGKLFKIVR